MTAPSTECVGPPARRLAFAADGGAVYLDGVSIWPPAAVPARQLELLLHLNLARPTSLPLLELRWRLTGRPEKSRVRSDLVALQELGLAAEVSDDRWVAAPQPVHLTPDSSRLRELALFIKAQISARRDRPNAANAVLLQATGAARAGDNPSVLRALTVPRGASTGLTQLERGTSARAHRPQVCLEAHTMAAEAYMAQGFPEDALHHVNVALSWLERVPSTATLFRTDWRVRLLAARGAACRLGAALAALKGASAPTVHSLLDQGRRPFEEAVASLGAAKDLPSELASERLRWVEGAQATQFMLLGDTRRAGVHLGRAEAELRQVKGDGSDVPETYLLSSRLELLSGSTGRADAQVREVEQLLRKSFAPAWVHGWLPRYKATVARAGGASRQDLSLLLRRAWSSNATFGFQRLQVLMRYAVWAVEPWAQEATERELNFRSELRMALVHWHRIVRGVPPNRCTCHADAQARRSVLPIACCVARIRSAETEQALASW